MHGNFLEYLHFRYRKNDKIALRKHAIQTCTMAKIGCSEEIFELKLADLILQIIQQGCIAFRLVGSIVDETSDISRIK